MIISFNLPLKGKKDCVIKEAVANKNLDIVLPPVLGQFYDKICGLVS